MATRMSVPVTNLRQMGRTIRRPQHTFQLRTRPHQIQPFFIAPVLPGETLKTGLIQSRVITDPIKNRLIGWWKEYYVFYVKHRDLDDRAELEQMVLDFDWTKANIDSATAQVKHYFDAAVGKEKINWVEKCLKRITEEYFRDEDEAWDVATLDGLPMASIGDKRGIWHSAMPEASVVFPDVSISTAGDDAFTMGELDEAQREFEFLRQSGFSRDMSYEDYLKTYGIRRPREILEAHRPELVRFMRQWQYPVSAINPTDGSAASAVQWSIAERIDKDRFFSEPGFLFGVTVTRPKVYLKNQTGNASEVLDTLQSWLPALMSDDINSSLKLIPDTHAPTGDVTDTNGVWIDVKDLFIYGDQFINFALTDTEAGIVALPTAALGKKYPSSTDVNALFTAASPANQIREDGLATLMIAGRQVDTSA